VEGGSLDIGGNGYIGGDLTVIGNVDAGSFSGGSFTPTLLELPNGSAGAPSLTFVSDTTSGEYWDTTGTPGQAWTEGGTKKMKLDTVNGLTINCPVITTAGLGLSDGKLGTPSLFFNSDTKSGLYYVPSGPTAAVQIDGSSTMLWNSTHNTSTVPVQFTSGSDSAPSITFSSDTGSGLSYNSGSTSVDTSVGGSAILLVSGSSVTSTQKVLLPTGPPSAPPLAFAGDHQTGMFQTIPGNLSFTLSGNEFVRMSVSSNVVQSLKDFQLGANNFYCTGTVNADTFTTTSTQPFLLLAGTTLQSIPSLTGPGAFTTYTNWTTTTSQGSNAPTLTSGTTVTIVQAGNYQVNVQSQWAINGTGYFVQGFIQQSGSKSYQWASYNTYPSNFNGDYGYSINQSSIIPCSVNDTLTLMVTQVTPPGIAINFGGPYCYLSIYLLP